MKKLFKIIISIILVGIFLSGCEKKETINADDNIEQETTSEQFTTEDGVETQTMTEGGDVNNTEIDLPIGFVQITPEDSSNIPDTDGLVSVLSDVMEDIGVTGLETVAYGNLEENNGIVTIQAYFVTNSEKKLIIPSMYITFTPTKEWSVISIKDVDTGNYYYVSDGVEDTVDLYDYRTGELVSEKTKTDDDVMDEYYQELERIDQEFDEKQEALEEKYITGNTKVSELTYMDKNIVDTTITDMKQYEYIKDAFIEVDEEKKEIDIVVQIPSSTDMETAKMAGEDVARYLAAMANFANSYYEIPGSESIGGIYDKYDLVIYVDDGNGNYNIYGGKVTTSKKITWRY